MKNSVDKKIIDIHAHALSFNREETGCFLSKKFMRTLSFNVIRRFYGIKKRDSEKVMDDKVRKKIGEILNSLNVIDYVVFIAFDGVYDKNGGFDEKNTHFYITNDYVRDLSNEYEKALYGASVNPNRKDSLKELERVIKEGACLIKWIPNTHDIKPDDTKYKDFYKMMAKNRIPLLVHTGNEYALNVVDQSFGDFKRLALPLEEGVIVIAAHGGGLAIERRPGDFDTLISFLKEYDNFYVDTSALFLLNKRLHFYRLSKARDVHHKIVYGSDWPIPSNPFFLVKGLSPLSVLKSFKIKNSIERNLFLTKKLNFSEEIFYTGYKIIKKDFMYESV